MGGSGNLPVGPGIWGFIAFFVLAVALWFLVRNMNGRLRRMAYRDRDEADQLHTDDADGTRVIGSGDAEAPRAGQGVDPGTDDGTHNGTEQGGDQVDGGPAPRS
ncbi:hypothetical protein GCM10009740_07420 [Terrabacter terrae]|uniref:Uncharacterized protein n=1 Tax=Terrabacter terrae TaxID=318434 RepID=A0ABN2TUL7_9MICO